MAAIFAAGLERKAALVKAGLANPYEEHHKRPLVEHLADWHAAMVARATARKHADESASKVKRILIACRFRHRPDLSASRVQAYNAERRAESLSNRMATALVAVKAFCKWCVQDRRAAESPLAHLAGFNVRLDVRHDRRALSEDDLWRLLVTTRRGPTRSGMAGPARAMLYRTAVETGFRANELRSPTPLSCDLDGDDPVIVVAAGYSKRRRGDVQPIRRDFAGELGRYLQGRDPAASIFKMPDKPAEMLRGDLEAAPIPYTDGGGRCFVSHALRHPFIGNLTPGRC